MRIGTVGAKTARWLPLLLVAAAGCGRGETDDAARTGDASGGAGGTRIPSGGASGGGTSGGGSSGGGGGGSGGAAALDCTDRNRAECLPTSLSPPGTDSGAVLTVAGRDVYWIRSSLTFERTMQRTSLDTGTTTQLPFSSGFDASVLDFHLDLVHDDAHVYLVSDACCPNPTDAIVDYAIGDGSFRTIDLQHGHSTSEAATISGEILVAFDERLAFYPLPVDATTAVPWLQPSPAGASPWETRHVATDGSAFFVNLERRDIGQGQVVRFDHHVPTLLAEVPMRRDAQLKSLVADERTVYLAIDTQILALASASPGPTRVLFDAAPNTPQFLLVDGTSLYWADEIGLHSMPKAGGATTVIAPFDGSPATTAFEVTDIAQSDDFIVWTGTHGTGLMKVHK